MKRIYLRKLEKKDATEEYVSWFNDPEVTRFIKTKKATKESILQYIEMNQKANCRLFGIFYKENDKHIGNVRLSIDFKKKKATVGITIGDKDFRGKGIAPEVLKVIFDYAFNELKLKEVNLDVISINKPALRAYEKAGFVKYYKKKEMIEGKPGHRIYMRVRCSN